MARRLKFEGANVLGVVEILSYASGLPRNVVQCLDDYDIPLFLNHTVTCIEGKERLESVTIAQVDKKRNILPGSEKNMKCDTLLLSLGLIPENELANDVDIKIDDSTGGPIVNQYLETSMPGVFACGNCLQVYDTVDVLSEDAKIAGKNAAKKSTIKNKKSIKTNPGKGVRYVVPQIITNPGKTHMSLRVEKPGESTRLHIVSNGNEIYSKKLPWVNPANMVCIDVDITDEILEEGQDLEVYLNG